MYEDAYCKGMGEREVERKWLIWSGMRKNSVVSRALVSSFSFSSALLAFTRTGRKGNVHYQISGAMNLAQQKKRKTQTNNQPSSANGQTISWSCSFPYFSLSCFVFPFYGCLKNGQEERRETGVCCAVSLFWYFPVFLRFSSLILSTYFNFRGCIAARVRDEVVELLLYGFQSLTVLCIWYLPSYHLSVRIWGILCAVRRRGIRLPTAQWLVDDATWQALTVAL